MSWWPWELEQRVQTLEGYVSSIAEQMVKISNKVKGQDMSKLHDRLSTLVSDLDKNADTVIANSTENETAFQDIITSMEAIIDKLKKKIADDASEGGSTGAGSGAR
jgi:uncharacterized coiled-coil protein SlyX